MTPSIDYSLYLVTDRGLALGRPIDDIIAAALDGGVTCVQLREKHCSSREYLELALKLKPILETHRVPLIINDRIDIALAADVDGVHLGQTDLPLETARAIVGRRMIIGISVESASDALEAEKGGADYISVSPVYNTPTKTDTAPALGLAGVNSVCRRVDLPVIGIGGINTHNAADVIKAGAVGVAVVSAIMSAESPARAAETLKQIIHRAKHP